MNDESKFLNINYRQEDNSPLMIVNTMCVCGRCKASHIQPIVLSNSEKEKVGSGTEKLCALPNVKVFTGGNIH